jgi:hypothetical protein
LNALSEKVKAAFADYGAPDSPRAFTIIGLELSTVPS